LGNHSIFLSSFFQYACLQVMIRITVMEIQGLLQVIMQRE
jgi:hypothetical protein